VLGGATTTGIDVGVQALSTNASRNTLAAQRKTFAPLCFKNRNKVVFSVFILSLHLIIACAAQPGKLPQRKIHTQGRAENKQKTNDARMHGGKNSLKRQTGQAVLTAAK
jgi:hypothetical protein